MTKQRLQLSIGIVSLVTLLVYTLAHTGGLLSGYVTPGIVGYIAAFGIESAVVSLSLRIGDLRKSQQSTGFFYFVLVSTVAVSGVANTAEGFYTSEGVKLTLSTVERLDVVQAFIGLTATGLISLIVLALSEIVGTDVNQAIKPIVHTASEVVILRKAIDDLRATVNAQSATIDTLQQQGNVQASTVDTRRAKLLTLMNDGDKQLSRQGLAEALGVSVSTVRADIKALNGAVK